MKLFSRIFVLVVLTALLRLQVVFSVISRGDPHIIFWCFSLKPLSYNEFQRKPYFPLPLHDFENTP